MYKTVSILFAAVILAFIPLRAKAAAPRIQFEELSLDDGLSQSIVECIIQDRYGFIWLGTEDGLNRYDGYQFTIIRNDPDDTNSLAYNHVLSLLEDTKGKLWIGTFHGGLNIYDPISSEFTLYTNDPVDDTSISHDFVSAILQDRTGTVWIGTGNGLNRYHPESGSFTRYLYTNSIESNIEAISVLEILEDDTGRLWVGTGGAGLYLMDEERKGFTNFRADDADPYSLTSDQVRCIYQDRQGTVWIGTDGGGLMKYEEPTGMFISFLSDQNDDGSLTSNRVYAVHEDMTGSFWIGTNGGGLDLMDRESGTFVNYSVDPGNPSSLSNNEVYDILEDRSGILWLGTYGGGANKFDSKRKKFSHFTSDPNEPNTLSHPIVWSIAEEADGILWIGTHGGGLNRLDRKTGLYTYFRHDPDDPHSICSDFVRLVVIDKNGDIWLGTNGGGISRFDKNSGKFTNYRHDPLDPASISHNEIRSINEDSRGVMWIGTYGGGLNRFDRTTGRFRSYRNDPDDPSSISVDFIREMIEDSEGRLWIGTQGGGLELFDRKSDSFIHHRADPDDTTSISSDYVFTMHEDSKGVFWIGTMGGGLNIFDRETGDCTTFSEKDGLANNSIYGILEDEQDRLWMSTNYGLSRYDKNTGQFKNYTELDGLQSNEFNGGSYYKSRSGEFFFGGINGFNSFFPGEITDNPYVPPVVITSFLKLNKEVRLDSPVTDIDEIKLSYRDYVFSFEFSALDFTAPAENQYAYMMEGLDEDWIYTGSDKRHATFTTLKPGSYIFRVKGSNNDGLWNESGTSISVIITPPFWKTAWFRSLLALIAAATAYTLYRWRVSNVRLSAELDAAHIAQMSIMPSGDPTVEGFDISGICIPANEVGGDFYDYIWLDNDKTKFAIAIGDVSGKAMKAAMIAVMSSGMICSKANETESIAKILTDINNPLHSKTDATMFTTLFLASFDTRHQRMSYANAGFNIPLLKSQNTVDLIDDESAGPPLGIIGNTVYPEGNIHFTDGDVMIIFSDGITDMRNAASDFYDESALKKLLHSMDTSPMSSREIRDTIVKDVMDFAGKQPQYDDITLVVIKSLSRKLEPGIRVDVPCALEDAGI